MTVETIEFMEKSGTIEESAGRRKFQINLESEIKDYEKKMLCTGTCPYIIPMHILPEEDVLLAVYDFTGYLQLKEYAGRKTECSVSSREVQRTVTEVLQILSGILECIKGMEDYLIFPDRITLHTDVIFIDLKTGRTSLAFYPQHANELTLQSRITGMIREMAGLFCSEEAERYLNKIEDFIYEKNPGLDGIISFLGSMQREADYIYWNAKNFRSIEEQESMTHFEQVEKRRKPIDFNRKTIALLIFTAAGLLASLFSGKLSMINFTGLSIIIGAIDLQIIRKHLDTRNI